MHSYLSAFCVLWFIRMETVWLMFSSLHTMGSSIPQHWGTGIPGSWERLFPAGSQDVSLCQCWLNQPVRQTLQQTADLSLPLVSSLSKISLLQRALSCCVDAFILHFLPLGLFFLSPANSEFLLFEATEVQTEDDFSTQIPFLGSPIGCIGVAFSSSLSHLN